MKTSTFRIPFLLFIGALLMQTAWILALPPFRGIDEFDHAFRAAAVADGQWKPSFVAASDGRGDLLEVPEKLVTSARPICEWYGYTGPDNCRPVEYLANGQVVVASAAARYRPAFYWLIGTPAEGFEGAPALYAMRFTAALLCSGLIALAAWSLTLWARTSWPYVGLVLAMSPVAVYSTAVAAPNGVEICAGLALWCSLLGLTRRGLSTSIETRLLLASLPSAIVLASVRQLGPLFLALIVATVALALGWRGVQALAKTHSRVLTVAAIINLVAVTANFWWIKSVSQLGLEENPNKVASPIATTFAQVRLWTAQLIAAFPTRTEPAPSIVYAIWILFFVVLIAASFFRYQARLRSVLIVATVASFLVPIGLTLMTISRGGAIWQGRYGLPFAVGIPLIAGLMLESRAPRHRLARPLIVIGGLALVAAHVISVQDVFLAERAESPLSGDPTWFVLHAWAPAFLMLLGGLSWLLTLWSAPRWAIQPQDPSPPPAKAMALPSEM